MLIRYAAWQANTTLHFELDKKTLTGPIKFDNTLSTSAWANLTVPVHFSVKGTHVLTIVYDYAVYNLRFLIFFPDGKPYPVPGTIPIVGFDPGGEGVGYHDNDASNNGNKYRITEGVDIEQNKVEGGYDVGWTNGGEWMDYTIDVKKDGQYSLAVTAGSPNDPSADGSFRVEIDGQDISGPMNSPNTGGYQNWEDVSKLVTLDKGVHTLRIYELSGGYNLRKITLTSAQ
jgi:hypothetical protein